MAKADKDLPWHYIVTVAGTYYVKLANGKAKMPYEVEVRVPYEEKVTMPMMVDNPLTGRKEEKDITVVKTIDEIGILSYLVNSKRLVQIVRKKHPDFHYLREKEVINLKLSDPDMPLPRNVECLNLSQLKGFIKATAMPIKVKLFPDLKDLRNAVLNYQEGPDSYAEFERRWRKRNAIYSAFSNSFDDLNPDWDTDNDEPVAGTTSEV